MIEGKGLKKYMHHEIVIQGSNHRLNIDIRIKTYLSYEVRRMMLCFWTGMVSSSTVSSRFGGGGRGG